MTNDVNHPILKVVSVALVYIAGLPWGTIGAMISSFYGLLMIFDWFWKKFWKPFLQRRGVLKGPPKQYMETTDRSPL